MQRRELILVGIIILLVGILAGVGVSALTGDTERGVNQPGWRDGVDVGEDGDSHRSDPWGGLIASVR